MTTQLARKVVLGDLVTVCDAFQLIKAPRLWFRIFHFFKKGVSITLV